MIYKVYIKNVLKFYSIHPIFMISPYTIKLKNIELKKIKNAIGAGELE